jgi:hypothetical protein
MEQPDELIVTSQNGMVIRMPVAGISVQGRNTMGVRLMRLEEADRVRGVDRIIIPPGNGDALKPPAIEGQPCTVDPGRSQPSSASPATPPISPPVTPAQDDSGCPPTKPDAGNGPA